MFLSNTIRYIKYILAKLSKDSVGAFSAQAAFFMIISFFPFVMLLLTLLQYLPWTEQDMVDVSLGFLPETVGSFVTSLIGEIYTKASGTIVSVAAVTALWSASKGVFALMKGFRSVYEIERRRSYVRERAVAVLYTFVFVVILLLTIGVLVFGNSIFRWLSGMIPALSNFEFMAKVLRFVIGLVLLVLFFLLMYMVLPNRKSKLRYELPGAVITAVGWIGFSLLYSFYIDNFSNYSYIYGSITAIVLFMLWLYFCMYITFVGAEVNMFLRYGMIADLLQEKKRERKKKRKEKQKQEEEA